MVLKIRSAWLSTGESMLFQGLDLTVPSGSVLTIMGPSGCGKSSLLHWIIGQTSRGLQTGGSITLDGMALDGVCIEERRIGLLFQDDLLFPHMNVGENLAFALPRGLSRAERRRRISQALRSAELPGCEDRDVATLSGGQRARIACMRCLLSEPRAVLLDEPFSRLDAKLKSVFRSFISAQIQEAAIPALLVTHDPEDAKAVGGQILRLEDYRPAEAPVETPRG